MREHTMASSKSRRALLCSIFFAVSKRRKSSKRNSDGNFTVQNVESALKAGRQSANS